MLESTEWVLVVVCFFGSLVSVSIGTSCGLSFAAMVTVLPPTTALPLHGLIEGLSSGIRWAVLRRHVCYQYVVGFMTGGSIGLIVGWPLLGIFSEQALTLTLGLFLLITLWFPLRWLKLTPFTGGASTSCLTILVGATGPLVAALLARNAKSHRTVVGTQGACTLFQHWGKVLIFTLSGFSFSQHLELIAALSVATVTGTLLGKYLLNIIPRKFLRTALRTVVTLLGIRLVLVSLPVQSNEAQVSAYSGLAIVALLAATSYYLGYKMGNNKSPRSSRHTGNRAHR